MTTQTSLEQRDKAFADAWLSGEAMTEIGARLKMSSTACYRAVARLGLPRRAHPQTKMQNLPPLGETYRPEIISAWPADMGRFEDCPKAAAANRRGRHFGPVTRPSMPVLSSTLSGRWI